LRSLNVFGHCTREYLAMAVDTTLAGCRGMAALDRLHNTRGFPKSITADHGPEVEGQVLDGWAYLRGAKLAFIRLGKPVCYANAESFNSRFEGECVNEH
jgi:hypothetical protein